VHVPLEEDLPRAEEQERVPYHRRAKHPETNSRTAQTEPKHRCHLSALGWSVTALLSEVSEDHGESSPSPCDLAEAPAGRKTRAEEWLLRKMLPRRKSSIN